MGGWNLFCEPKCHWFKSQLKNVYLGTCLFVFFSKRSLFKTHIRLKTKKPPSILGIELENETCLLVNRGSGQSWWVGLEGLSL